MDPLSLAGRQVAAFIRRTDGFLEAVTYRLIASCIPLLPARQGIPPRFRMQRFLLDTGGKLHYVIP